MVPNQSRWARPAAIAAAILAAVTLPARTSAQAPIKTESGLVSGSDSAVKGVRAFLGIPYGAPTSGANRWRAPQPAPKWDGIRAATSFGARCIQARVFGDMVFRDEMSEDCLAVNVWTPAAGTAKLPVMVWIYGGGFQAGSASEPRQDGARLASRGVVVVSLNYRLGLMGFFAHPDLSKESPSKTSGNYGILDQIAALQWVQKNVAAFGGDPGNVTIFGESAGSFSVSMLMASPLAKGLFHKAIGESGASFPAGPQPPLGGATRATAEADGVTFATRLNATTLAELRAKPATDLIGGTPPVWFSPIVDGHVIPAPVSEIFAKGQQAKVPLLAGWNAGEVRSSVTLNPRKLTAESFKAELARRFGASADRIAKAYPAATDTDAIESAAALASDSFISYGTWKWLEVHRATGGAKVYRYVFDRDIPIEAGRVQNGTPVTAKDIGARHAGEIEYVFGTLDSIPKVTWAPEDTALANAMMAYWSSFAKTGTPAAKGHAVWPAFDQPGGPVMHLGATVRVVPEPHRDRYEAFDAWVKTVAAPK